MRVETIERFSAMDTITKLKHIASNLSRTATYWEAGDRDSCTEIAVEARHFGDAAVRGASRETQALMIVLDVHLGMVIARLRDGGDVSDLMPLTRRFWSALLLLTVSE